MLLQLLLARLDVLLNQLYFADAGLLLVVLLDGVGGLHHGVELVDLPLQILDFAISDQNFLLVVLDNLLEGFKVVFVILEPGEFVLGEQHVLPHFADQAVDEQFVLLVLLLQVLDLVEVPLDSLLALLDLLLHFLFFVLQLLLFLLQLL